jgi:hypothetical protein
MQQAAAAAKLAQDSAPLVRDKNGNMVPSQAGLDLLTAQHAITDKDNYKVIKDADQNEHIIKMGDTPTDVTPQNIKTVASGLGDMSKEGPEYLATIPPDRQGILMGMLDGTVQPPTSFAMAKPYWQNMIAAAKHLDKNFDETNWGGRHTMNNQLAMSSNSSMGGILSNGESSFKHLAEFTQSAAGLGNASHDYPGGGMIAHLQNTIGNTGGGSNTFAKIKAINDNLSHYGQEATKFYSGTGGGVEERMNALKEMNPTSTSSEEMAAYAEKEKGLMLDRLNTKLQQIRNVYGEQQGNRIIAQHMPDIQRNIAMIDANVARLNGNPSNAAGAPPATATPQRGFMPPPGAIPRAYQGKTYYYDPATKQPYAGQ